VPRVIALYLQTFRSFKLVEERAAPRRSTELSAHTTPVANAEHTTGALQMLAFS
jgi:hypothetical protein